MWSYEFSRKTWADRKSIFVEWRNAKYTDKENGEERDEQKRRACLNAAKQSMFFYSLFAEENDVKFSRGTSVRPECIFRFQNHHNATHLYKYTSITLGKIRIVERPRTQTHTLSAVDYSENHAFPRIILFLIIIYYNAYCFFSWNTAVIHFRISHIKLVWIFHLTGNKASESAWRCNEVYIVMVLWYFRLSYRSLIGLRNSVAHMKARKADINRYTFSNTSYIVFLRCEAHRILITHGIHMYTLEYLDGEY